MRRTALVEYLGKSVKTLQRWELQGVLPKPQDRGDDAYYADGGFLGAIGRSLEEVKEIIIQGDSVYFGMKDGTAIWRKSQRRRV